MYQSDITRFLIDLKEKNPHIEREQRKGRSLLWDRPQDRETQARNKASRVRQSAYVYQTKP